MRRKLGLSYMHGKLVTTKLLATALDPTPQEERCWHAACCLNYGQQHPQLLVTGGFNGRVLGDAWILDIDGGKWRKVKRKFRCVYCTPCDS